MKWLLFFPSLLFCLSAGNPSFPEMGEKGIFTPKKAKFGVRVGYEGEWMSHRKMRNYHDLSNTSQIGTLTLNWVNQLEVYGGVGEGKLKGAGAHRYWMAGGRVILTPFDILHVGVNGNYFKQGSLSGWQVAVGASYPVGAFYPYLSAVTEETDYTTYRSKRKIGGAAGLGISPHGPFDLNIEGRFIGELSFSLSVRMRI